MAGAAWVSFWLGVREEPCGRRPTSRRRWERSCGAARTCARQPFVWDRGRVGFPRHPRSAPRTSGGKASAALLVANGYLAARAGGDDRLDPVMNDARVAGFPFCELPSRIRPEHGKHALAAAGGHKHVPASRIHRHLTLCCARTLLNGLVCCFAAPRPDHCAGRLCERVGAWQRRARRTIVGDQASGEGTQPPPEEQRREATNATNQRPSPLRGIPAILYRGFSDAPPAGRGHDSAMWAVTTRVISPTSTSIANMTRPPLPGLTIGDGSWSSRSTATAAMARRPSSTAAAGSTDYAATLSRSASESNTPDDLGHKLVAEPYDA
jgi:hypothetical protein